MHAIKNEVSTVATVSDIAEASNAFAIKAYTYFHKIVDGQDVTVQHFTDMLAAHIANVAAHTALVNRIIPQVLSLVFAGITEETAMLKSDYTTKFQEKITANQAAELGGIAKAVAALAEYMANNSKESKDGNAVTALYTNQRNTGTWLTANRSVKSMKLTKAQMYTAFIAQSEELVALKAMAAELAIK